MKKLISSKNFWTIILIVFIIIFIGGILTWQYFKAQKEKIIKLEEPSKTLEEEETPKETPEETPEEVEIPELKAVKQSFSFPYPVNWKDQDVQFSLTAVSLGERLAPLNLYKTTTGEKYKIGEKIYALTLYLKIESKTARVVHLNIRRLIIKEGGEEVLIPPNNSQFYFPESGGNVTSPNRTYFDQEVIFVVPESDKVFDIITGDPYNTSFIVILLEDGSLRIEKTFPG